jgi:hypothetical protein
MTTEVKLVAESLTEWENQNVNEVLGLSLKEKWEKVDKKDENALVEFAMKLAKSSQVAANTDILRKNLLKLGSEGLLKELNKAAKYWFNGAWTSGTGVWTPTEKRKVSGAMAGHSASSL